MLQTGTHAKAGSLRRAKLDNLNGIAEGDAGLGLEESDDDDDADDVDDKAAAAKEEAEIEGENADLEAAQKKQRDLNKELKNFKDDDAYENMIGAEVAMITNETQSAALSGFLGAMRNEMRLYANPAYPAYLEAQIAAAEKKAAGLEKELGHEPAEEVAAKKKEAKKITDEKKEKEGKEKDAPVAEEKQDTATILPSAKDVAKKAAETWAISFFADVALMAVIFGMACSSNLMVRNYTWFLIDQVIAVFLAVMYFQAFDSLLDFHQMESHNAVMASIIHAIVMLFMVLILAYGLRRQRLALAVLCGAGAHVVSFSSIHAAASVQNKVWVSWSFTSLAMIGGLIVLAFALAVIGFLVYTAKKKAQLLEDSSFDAFREKTDDLENDFGAMAFSVVFTMFMRFLITGHHPVDDDTEFDHTWWERTAMFIYACACMIIAVFVVTFCSKKAEESSSYAVKRMMNFFTTVAAMNVAWSFLYWGEWEFFGVLFPGEAIKGRVMFAILSTVLGALGLIAISKMSNRQAKMGSSGKTDIVALTAISLVIAWGWELCFDAAVEDMCEGVSHPAGWKIGTTVMLFALVVPVYAFNVKPISDPAADAIGA